MERERGISLKIAALACVFSCGAAASAVEIWATDNLGPFHTGGGDRIIRFDSANPLGTVVEVGDAGVDGLSGLAFDAGGNLWAQGAFGGAAGNFYSINTSTGVATLVGSNGLNLNDLSWNPTNGAIEAVDGAGNIYSMNTGNGQATLLGTVTGAGSPLFVGMATTAAGGRIVHDLVTDAMYSLAGFSATMMGTGIGFDTNFSQGMTIDTATGDWYLGAFNNGLFESQVWLMDNVNGDAQTLLGQWPQQGGLPLYETGDLAINPVPEPATFVAIGLGLAALALRRRK